MKLEQSTAYEVSFEEAKLWVNQYAEGKPAGYTKAFLIDRTELEAILGLSEDVKYIRVYFGQDNSTENPEKLLAVPANIEGSDMINVTGRNSHIYDFIAPCPPTCDALSPLMVSLEMKANK